MAQVICDMSMSLDGYVTGPNDSRENPFGDGAGMMHDWISDAATDEDRALLQEMLDGVGAIVMGRTSFDKNEGDGGWGEGGPVGDIPCFVVTHHEPATSHPSIYTFVTDGVASAVAQAKAFAGDKDISLTPGNIAGQAFAAGLVDEVRVDLVPVVFGAGVRFFGDYAGSPLLLENPQVVQGHRVTHLHYRLRKP